MIFIPISDDNTGRTITPFVNYTLIAINLFVFIVLQEAGKNQKFTFTFAAVPAEITSGEDKETPDRDEYDKRTNREYTVPGLQPTPISVYITLITSMFMHGGWLHLGGNMLFLWIFGDNIEDDLGHIKYLCFYLLCGIIATLSHVVMNTDSMIPMLGASGAIAAVMGAYLVQHPGRQVVVLIIRVIAPVPAIIVMAGWFVMQIIGGVRAGDNVAYAAHIGGFIAGVVLIKLFQPGPRTHGGATYVKVPGKRDIDRSRWE
ncbi:MAG: rhomboid family intramembrane serine protease [Pirellulales bacterium]|nr:rhomboid family intramembrane serine protease [Pirellulales bacterium]